VPAYFFYVLRKNKNLIKNLEDKDNLVLYNLPKAERYEVESFMKRYGFLFLGVNLDYYYWEICVMLRKVAIIFATEFLSSVSGVVQVLVAVMIMVAGIMLVIRHRPFEDEAATRANILSQAVQMLLMYIGLYYMTGEGESYMDPESGFDWLSMPFIVIPSLAFFLQWLAKIRTGLLIIAFNSNKGLFKLLTLNLVDANEFFRVHIQHTHTHHGSHHKRH
jgi:hypothetical protein